jgi:hypothetical protein
MSSLCLARMRRSMSADEPSPSIFRGAPIPASCPAQRTLEHRMPRHRHGTEFAGGYVRELTEREALVWRATQLARERAKTLRGHWSLLRCGRAPVAQRKSSGFLNRVRRFDSCRGHLQSLYPLGFCSFGWLALARWGFLNFRPGAFPAKRCDRTNTTSGVQNVRLGMLNPSRVREVPGEGKRVARQKPGIDVVEAGDPHD